MKTIRVLITLLIVTTIGSGCATKEKFIEPLCLPDRPIMVDMSVEHQREFKEWNAYLFTVVVVNDELLKRHIATVEKVVVAHNEQFESECW